MISSCGKFYDYTTLKTGPIDSEATVCVYYNVDIKASPTQAERREVSSLLTSTRARMDCCRLALARVGYAPACLKISPYTCRE